MSIATVQFREFSSITNGAWTVDSSIFELLSTIVNKDDTRTLPPDVFDSVTVMDNAQPKVQLAAEAFRDAALMVEKYFPGIFNGMSLMFKTELVAMTCFLHKNVEHWLENWQFNFHLYKADVKNCEYLFQASIDPTVEFGVKAAFSRSFKNEEGDTWIELGERWERLNTKCTAEELRQQFMKDIRQMTTRYIDWIKCRDSGERDLLLKNRYGNLR